MALAVLLMLSGTGPAKSQETSPPQVQPTTTPAPSVVTITPVQLFAFADKARDVGDYKTAEAAYRALASNPNIELRTEARFRLAMMLADSEKRYADAAVLLRQILDEKPKVASIRLELARMNALLGRPSAATRELRAAEAAGLPPEVDRMVHFYANALYAAKPVGGSLEIGLAPDTNINRATRSGTLGTIIGDFTLDQNARARSGVGIDLRGQTYWRRRLHKTANVLVRLSGSANMYRESRFDDNIVSLQAGPEYVSGTDRIGFSAGPAWRWYGLKPYTVTFAGSGWWQHPMGKRAQMRVEGGVGKVTNRLSALQSGMSYVLSASFDRAYSARFGGGVQISGDREAAHDPGYATTSGGASVYAFRELGKTTLIANLGYSHLEADSRLFLYPRRRIDDRVIASASVTFRALRLGEFAPIMRLSWERNRSTIEIYDYKRLSGEVGITAAF